MNMINFLFLLLLYINICNAYVKITNTGNITTECSYSHTICQNGGTFNASNCLERLTEFECGIDGPSSPNPDKYNWWQQRNCSCPKGWYGTACQIAKSPATLESPCVGDNPYFDGYMINIASKKTKQIECFMEWTDDNVKFYSLRLHKSHFLVDLNSEGYGTIDFELLSRMKYHDTTSPFYRMCKPDKYDIKCHLSECTGYSTDDGLVFYDCLKADCTSCGIEDSPYYDKDCSSLLGNFVKGFGQNIRLQITGVNTQYGHARLRFISGTLVIGFVCSTGQCVDQTINPNPKLTAAEVHQFIAKILIFGCTSLLLILIFFIILSCRAEKGIDDTSEENKRILKEMKQGLCNLPRFGIAFTDITYSVPINNSCIQLCSGKYPSNRSAKEIINGFIGAFTPGSLTGILGPSGAGKSSLLDIIAQQNKPGWVDGYVNYYSEKTNCRKPNDVLGYVMQHDVLMATQTVREALLFAGKMRLPPSFTNRMVRLKVENLMKELKIDHIADTKIGYANVGGGISGGERRRLAIGIELLVDPRILVLDEPTSGLDSSSTQIVMNILRKAANNGICIVMTIHQPPSNIFKMFDQVLLLTQNGKQAYLGPPKRSLEHMIRLGYSQSNRHVNPAEFLLDIVSQDDEDELDRISNSFMSSELMQRLSNDVKKVRDRDHYNFEGTVIERTKNNHHNDSENDFDNHNNIDNDGEIDSLLPVRDPLPHRLSVSRIHREDSVSSITDMIANLKDKDKNEFDTDSLSSYPRQSPPTSNNLQMNDPVRTYSNKSTASDSKTDDEYTTTDDDDTDHHNDSSSPKPELKRELSGGYHEYLTKANRFGVLTYKRPRIKISQQLLLLMVRQFRHVIRNPMLLMLQYGLTCVVSLMVGFLYKDLSRDIAGSQNRVGAFLFIITFFTLMSMTSIGDLVNERHLFEYEKRSNYYHSFPYFVSKVCCDIIPLRVLPAVLFSLICYHMIGFVNDSLKWANFTQILILVNLVATATSFLFSSLHSTVPMANLSATLYFIFVLLFCGLFLNNDSDTSIMVKIQWASFAHYAWEALVVNDLSGQLCEFNPTIKPAMAPKTINCDLYIKNFGLRLNSVVSDFIILTMFFLVKFILGYLALKYISHNNYLIRFDFSKLICCKKNKKRRRDSKIVSEISSKHNRLQQSLDLTHISLAIIFKDISYSVPKIKRTIIKGITGYARVGHLIGLIGPSGAGKSSFLDILAHRQKSGVVNGLLEVFYNGKLLNKPDEITSYVPQHDVLMATQTVEEALTFSAKMRLPTNISSNEIKTIVKKIMKDLSISHIANTFIGNPNDASGLSGGERKRLAIGIELVANPKVLILDEPTSGLDSRSCEVVMQVLRGLTYNGCTVILSIHQPATNIYNMFDHVLVFSKFGEQIYFGPPSQSSEFLRHAGHRVRRHWINPAEVLLDIASLSSKNELNQLCQAYKNSQYFSDVEIRLNELYKTMLKGSHYQVQSQLLNHTATGDEKSIDKTKPMSSPTLLPILSTSNNNHHRQFKSKKRYRGCFYRTILLMRRSLLNLMRDPSLLIRQILLTSSFALILGLIFFHLDKGIPGLQNRTGLLFFLCIYFALTAWSSLSTLIDGRILFSRERASKVYSTLSYFLSEILSDFLPLRIIPSILFAVITYPLVGLRASEIHFVTYVYLTIAVNLVASAACLMFSALTDTVGQANLLATVFFSFNIIFGGLLLNSHTDNNNLNQLRWGSYMHAGYEALMINEFHGAQNFSFSAKGVGSLKLITGDTWLTNFALKPSHFNFDVFMLAGQCILFLFITLVALVFKPYVM